MKKLEQDYLIPHNNFETTCKVTLIFGSFVPARKCQSLSSRHLGDLARFVPATWKLLRRLVQTNHLGAR